MKLDVDGRDVTSAFALRPDGRFVGLVEDLANGRNVLRARCRRARNADRRSATTRSAAR